MQEGPGGAKPHISQVIVHHTDGVAMGNKIIVFGAHGGIGQHVIRLLTAPTSADTVTAVVRTEEQAATLKEIAVEKSKLSTSILDLEDASAADIEHIVKGHDVIVYTAGSKGKSLLRVDLDATVKTFEAAVSAGTLRYVFVSALSADVRERFAKTGLRDYMIAKHYSERILKAEYASKLKFTILQPTSLSNEEPTGKIAFFTKPDEPHGVLTRADAAHVICQVIDKESTIGKSIPFRNGDVDINSAF